MVCIVHAAGKVAQQSMVAESHGPRVHVGQGMRINFNSPVVFRKEALLGHERCANSEQTSFFWQLSPKFCIDDVERLVFAKKSIQRILGVVFAFTCTFEKKPCA